MKPDLSNISKIRTWGILTQKQQFLVSCERHDNILDNIICFGGSKKTMMGYINFIIFFILVQSVFPPGDCKYNVYISPTTHLPVGCKCESTKFPRGLSLTAPKNTSPPLTPSNQSKMSNKNASPMSLLHMEDYKSHFLWLYKEGLIIGYCIYKCTQK